VKKKKVNKIKAIRLGNILSIPRGLGEPIIRSKRVATARGNII
jgi:hypothetical protein